MSGTDALAGVQSVRLAAADLNGQARGKRIARAFADKALSDGTRFPFSVLNLDMWGDDIVGSPLVFEAGDPDGTLRPTGRGPVPIPWLDAPALLQPLWMFHDDDAPFAGDPRHALAQVIARYDAKGWTPVVATELEFYLVDDSGPEITPPPSQLSGRRRMQSAILSMGQLDAFDRYLSDLYAGCEAMGIPADTAISEGGPGQFEITLHHQPDAMKAADDTWLFKLLARGLARKHGFAASFMAKPYAEFGGNGLHTHVSVLDTAHRNIFVDGTQPSARLYQAIAGCLGAMAGTMLIFAPMPPAMTGLCRAPMRRPRPLGDRTIAQPR